MPRINQSAKILRAGSIVSKILRGGNTIWQPTVAPTGSIAITTPTSFRTYQRNAQSQASIAVSGTYTVSSGTLSGITVSLLGVTVQATLDAGNGTFTATLPNVPTGQGTLSASFSNNNSVSASRSFVGVGERFLCAGQSNMSGRGTNNQTYTIAGNGIRATLFGNDYTWKELVDPYDSNTGIVDTVSQETSTAGGSYILPLATYFLAQGIPVEFIPSAKGGTSSTQWLPGANLRNRSTLFGSALYRAEISGGVRGVLWHQGETDADTSIAQATITSNLRSIAETFQSQLGVQTFMARLQAFTGATGIANRARVIAAIDDAVSQSTAIEPGPDFGDIITDDNYHFQISSKLTTAADRWWACLSNFYALPGATSIPNLTPQGSVTIASPTANSSHTTSATIAVNGNYNFTSGRITGGLRIRIDGGAWTIFAPNLTALSGTYSASVTAPATAKTSTIEVAFVDNTAVTASVSVTIASSSPSPTPTEDSDVTTYANNIVAAGGSISTTQRNAHNTFAIASKASGTWQYIKAMHTLSGENLTSALVYFKKPDGVANSMTNTGFVAADYSSTLGLQGATNKFLNTGINPSTLGLDVNNFGLWGFLKANFGSGNQTVIGHQNTSTSPTSFTFLGQFSTGTREGGAIASGTTAFAAGASGTNYLGFIGVNNEASRTTKFYVGGALTITATAAGADSLINSNFYFMAMNGAGTGLNFFTGRGLLFLITEGLPSNLVSTLNTEVSNLISNLGR